MTRLLALLALLLCGPAWAQVFTDNFDCPGDWSSVLGEETLETSANWTKSSTGGAGLKVMCNKVAIDGTLQARRAYTAPSNGSADFYVQTDVLHSGVNIESLAIRIQDEHNYIGLVYNAGNGCVAYIRESSSDTAWHTENACNAQALRIEGEGTTIRFYADSGSGLTLIHTQNSVTTFQTEQLGGYVTVGAGGASDGLFLWDNFDTDALP